MSTFYEIFGVPVHSVLLFSTREAALNYPKGDITLGLCPQCGFISNTSFNPNLHEYTGSYESTQSCSESFKAFHRDLASNLIDQYGLHGKEIIEIGCGQGEFLKLLCEIGGNRGVGFDPAYNPPAAEITSNDTVVFIKDFYSQQYSGYKADFFVCKMTLEHIQNTAEFVNMVRQVIGNDQKAVVFFQVPDVTRILHEVAFWDIYYEHCSYFSPVSLAYLFQSCRFEILDLQRGYANQYLMIATRPGERRIDPVKKSVAEITQQVDRFVSNFDRRVEAWRAMVSEIRVNGLKSVIWGAGSKGVAFLTTLGIQDEIGFAVDINPNKHGTYMAGSGHLIVSPNDLWDYKPDIIFVMNPIYQHEIEANLARMGLSARLVLFE
jgi:hypothetical protein